MIRGKDYKLNLYEGDQFRSASASCKQSWPIHVKNDDKQKILEINMEIDELDATQRTDHHLHAEYDDLPGIHDAQNEESMFLRPKSFADFINSKGFAEKINGVVDKTGGQLFLMILKYSITNNLPISAITNLYKMINSMHQTPVLPDSKYFLEKILNPKSGVEFHAVCSYCSSYLGEFSTEVPIKDICDLCKKKEDVSQACKDNFFVLIKPDKQVKHLLEKYEDHYDYVMNERKPNDDFIEDIYDGIMYKKLRENVKEEFKNQYVSAVFNTDGAPKFESSNKSIWPLYLMLNELPKQDRLNNIICCGLWFNKKKPDMAIYLQKFVDMFNSIDPISCIIKSKNLFIKPYISSCCVDAPARAAVQGLIQYNGYLGCNWCLHPGFQSGTMLYPIVHPAPIPRTHEQIFEVMYNFDKNEENEFGIKYPSPLICLSEFDMVRGLTPDYMHMALEGVAKQMMNYYMSSIGDNDMEQLDLIMEKIAVPKQIKRYTRPISVRKDWKAREWENFTLYYSVPILKPLLTWKKYVHWLKFVEGVYIILQEKISLDELNKANQLFHEFVIDMAENHGLRAMRYNVHILLHACESVFNWGPVWTNSTFCFESANRQILNAIKSARGAGHQIIRHVSLIHSLAIIEKSVIPTAEDTVIKFCEDVLENRLLNALKVDNLTYFGKKEYINPNQIETDDYSANTLIFNKLIKNGCLYESEGLLKNRSNNSVAITEDDKYIQIIFFLFDEEKRLNMTCCKSITTKSFISKSRYSQMRIVTEVATNTHFIPTDYIKKVCVSMKVNKMHFICAVPNLIHY